MSISNSDEKTNREAWVAIPSEAELPAQMPPGRTYPYDFGFLPAMGRLLRTHGQNRWSFPETVRRDHVDP